MQIIELLSPAKNVDIGMEAIRHGADAVYIGAAAFGARSAAGNSTDDIERLCHFAHIYGARVYVTLNTILYDDELSEAERLIHELYRVGVDALIVQDLALLRLDLPPIALHASTQMDITTVEKAKFLAEVGFSQLVLAREMPLEQIKAIHEAVPVPLEAFVHGALCVSYSGRCYVSQKCFGRSANRGCCAQFCRLAFDLVDAEGHELIRQKHLLSLKDMNRTEQLEEMLEAGVCSLKIEGRLKDMSYVKNVVAHYRRAIDRVIEAHPDRYQRASQGKCTYHFEPQPEKSFNRGFTPYFLHERTKVASIDSPKSRGERIGKVHYVRGKEVCLNTETALAAGDGLCFLNAAGEMCGFRVNSVTPAGNVMLRERLDIPVGATVYRNHDMQWEKCLNRPSAERRLEVDIALRATADGFSLRLTDESGHSVVQCHRAEQVAAQRPQADNLRRNLSKLGNTPFVARKVSIPDADYFIPSSLLAEWRRLGVEALMEERQRKYVRPLREKENEAARAPELLTYEANVANEKAKAFYRAHGSKQVADAFELAPLDTATLMTCKHCILYDTDHCLKRTKREEQWKLPLHLRLSDGREFALRFDCARCEMEVRSRET